MAIQKLDVLICVGNKDIDFLLKESIEYCLLNFKVLKDIYLVVQDPIKVSEIVKMIKPGEHKIYLLYEDDVLPKEYRNVHGWYKQQLIKLHGDLICQTKFFCCLGADAIMLQQVDQDMLFKNGKPILYYNRYTEKCSQKHLDYERTRVNHISKTLKVEPRKTYLLGDFIMDFMVFDSEILSKLRKYMEDLYGGSGFNEIVVSKDQELEMKDKSKFGEWTLYAMFLLDVLNAMNSVKNSYQKFVAQLHSNADLSKYRFDSCIAHFVNKSFDKNYILDNIYNTKKIREEVREEISEDELEGLTSTQYLINETNTSELFWLPLPLLNKKCFMLQDIMSCFQVEVIDAKHLVNDLLEYGIITVI